jgi:hypothetical protein
MTIFEPLGTRMAVSGGASVGTAPGAQAPSSLAGKPGAPKHW